jgi:hypothetical protein
MHTLSMRCAACRARCDAQHGTTVQLRSRERRCSKLRGGYGICTLHVQALCLLHRRSNYVTYVNYYCSVVGCSVQAKTVSSWLFAATLSVTLTGQAACALNTHDHDQLSGTHRAYCIQTCPFMYIEPM